MSLFTGILLPPPPLSFHLRVAFAVLCESFKFNSVVRNNFHKSFCVETVANRLAAGVSAENRHSRTHAIRVSKWKWESKQTHPQLQ